MISTADIDQAVLEAMPGSAFRITLSICKSAHIPTPWIGVFEDVHRACQRLRKRGLIRYDSKTGWSKV